VTAAISYGLLLVSLLYVSAPSSSRRDFSFIAGVIGGLAGGVAVYVIRLISSLSFPHGTAPARASPWDLIKTGAQGLAFLLIGKGNVPNLPAVMNLLAFWDRSEPLRLGETFFYWLRPFVPGSEDGSLGAELGNRWGMGVAGVPPTIIGELYINFHYAGVILGMLFIGAAIGWFYSRVRRANSYWVYFIYFSILYRFIFVLPKGEFYNFAGAIRLFAPTVLVVALLYFIGYALAPASSGEPPAAAVGTNDTSG
jgi:hypothetical protein